MQGVLPSQTDKMFTINGVKFHLGVTGSQQEDTLHISLVREKVAGGGSYLSTGHSTWQFVYNMDASFFMAQFADRGMTQDEIVIAAFNEFTTKANIELAKFTGGVLNPPTIPTDLYQHIKLYLETKLSFRTDTNQLVFTP